MSHHSAEGILSLHEGVGVSSDHMHDLFLLFSTDTVLLHKILGACAPSSAQYYEYNSKWDTHTLAKDVTKLTKLHTIYFRPDINASTNRGLSPVPYMHNLY